MFYSHTLLSSKGPLGAIWVAAFLKRKLRKDVVAETSIPKTIDHIIRPRVPISLRVMAHLLLGVVRIYSKKVEYLHDECCESLTKIKNSIASVTKTVDLSEEAKSAPHDLITLPETFELDIFNLEDLGHQETECPNVHVKPHEQITLQEVWENDVWDPYETFSMDEDSYKGLATHSEFASTGIPVAEDVLDTQGIEASREQLQGNHLPFEEFVNHEISYVVEESSDSENDAMEIENHSKCIKKQGSHIEHTKLAERYPIATTTATTPGNLSPEASREKLWDDQLSAEDFLSHEILHMIEELTYSIDDCLGTGDHSKSIKDLGNHVEYIKLQEIYPVATVPAKTPEKPDLPPSSLGHSTPDFMVLPTPAKQEQERVKRKRKYFFDETVILSNEVMRKRLKHTKNILRGGGKSLPTGIGIWKAHKIFHVLQSFSEPSVPCISSELKALFQNNSRPLETELQEKGQPIHETGGLIECQPVYEAEQVDQELSANTASDFTGQPVYEAEQELPVDRPAYKAKQVDHELSANTASDFTGQPVYEAEQDLPVDRLAYKTKQVDQELSANMASDFTGQPGYEAEQELPEDHLTCEAERFCGELSTNNASDSLCSRMDEAQNSTVTGNRDTDHESVFDMLSEIENAQSSFLEGGDNWSIRTRAVWRCLQTFPTQKAGILNLTHILEGRTRTGCARIFMEILALKTLGYINVTQESPFGEILILETLKFKGDCNPGKYL